MHSYYGAVALIRMVVIYAQLLQCCDLDKYGSDTCTVIAVALISMVVIHAQLLLWP